ncbi:MAG TPA: HAD family hydrolase, partial [Treponemataceae bacterium]|nr:HAD family hydrolase [Treponemataceae bacterium]
MIHHLLLDLDNTLYPASGGMNEGITNRMMNYIASFLNVPLERAIQMRKEALPRYGTSLEWLKGEHNLTDDQNYFDSIHPPSEIEELQK